jgi:hypothetical protein
MNIPLHADTGRQLLAFRRRWHRLNRVRGFCGAMAVLLVGLIVAGLADGFLMLDQNTRTSASALAYLLAFATWWWLSGRYLLSPLSDREIARRFEMRWPGLEGHVLAAVELAETSAEAKLDSPAFREVLQRDVADRVSGLDMRAVLPGNVVNKWVVNFICVLAVLGGLLILPGLEFEQLILRALAPMAEIDRPSRVKIALVSPNAETEWLAVGDEVEIVVKVTGPRPEPVRLLVFYEDIHRTLKMVSMGDGTYAGQLTVGSDDVKFRVTGGDGSTGTLSLPTRARPQVVHYDKQYTYPEYAGREPRSIREADGDLAALEGTKVRLRMKVNQAVRAGELVIVSETGTNRVQLIAPEPDVVEAEVELLEAATYQVQLEAAETGFENRFAPKYEIKPWPDKKPKVTMSAPDSQAVVAPDERLTVSGKAKDEIALATVKHAYRVNEGEWNEVLLPLDNPTNSAIARSWDLILLNVRKGDRIFTKLIAADKKGNTSESATVQLIVGTPAVMSTRSEEVEQWNRLAEVMAAAARSAHALQKSFDDGGAGKFKSGNELERSQMAAGFKTAVGEIGSQIEAAEGELGKTLRLASAGREGARLGLVGEGLSLARQKLLREVEQESAAITKDVKSGDLTRMAGRVRSLDNQVKNLNGQFRRLLSRKKSSAAAEYFDQLAKRQDELNERARADTGTDPNVWKRLARRQSEAAAQVAKGEEMLADLQPDVPANFANRISGSQKDVGNARRLVDEAARKPEPGPEIRTPSEQLQRMIRNAEKGLRALAKSETVQAERAEQQLKSLRQTPSDQVRLANTALRAIEKSADKGETNADARRTAELNGVAAGLRDTARIEEQKRNGDPLLAAELGTGATAMEELAKLGNHEVSPNEGGQLNTASQALRNIEVAHRVAALEQALKQLSREERWEGDASNLATDRTGDWSWLNDEISAAQNDVRRSNLPSGVREGLERLVREPARREVGKEMLNRKNGKTPKPVGAELARLAEAATDARLAAEPARESSRRFLESLAPSAAEQLGRLAATARMQASAARQVSGERAPAGPAVTDLQSAQAKLSEGIQRQMEGIRREGNRQDVFRPEGRDQARDADDALAMIGQPAAAAAQSMNRAAASAGAADRRAALQAAADENQQLAKALQQVAAHMREQGDNTRQELRDQEEALGIREALDRRYAAAENMQRLAQANAGELRDNLAAQAKSNPELRAEMQRMTQEALGEAEQALGEAARAQQEAAQMLNRADTTPESRERMRGELDQLGAQADQFAKNTAAELALSSPDDKNLQNARTAMSEAANQRPEGAGPTASQMASQAATMQQKLSDAANSMSAAGNGDESSPATQAAQRIRQMADQAQSLSESLQEMGQSTPAEAMQAAARAQAEARSQVERAARQLEQSSEAAAAMDEGAAKQISAAADQAESVAKEQMGNAQQSLQDPGNVKTAQKALQEASQSLSQLQESVQESSKDAGNQMTQSGGQSESGDSAGSEGAQKAGGQSGQSAGSSQKGQANAESGSGKPQPSAGGQGQPAGDEAMAGGQSSAGGEGQSQGSPSEGGSGGSGKGSPSQWLARAVSAMNGGKQVTPEAADALRAALESQADSIRDARNNDQTAGAANQQASAAGVSSNPGDPTGGMPGTGGHGGTSEAGMGEFSFGDVSVDWGKLPPKVARDLRESLREGVSSEFRSQVNAYFRLIAEKSSLGKR